METWQDGAPGEPIEGAPLRVLIDGCEASLVPIWDRGLAYGDGLFETLLIRDGGPCQWARHLARLAIGCDRLQIPTPAVPLLESDVRSMVRGGVDGVLKILITRGTGGRGYRPPSTSHPRRALLLYPIPDYPAAWGQDGVAIRYCRTRATQNRSLAGIKHLNRLDSVLARAEWDDPEIAEGLMLREDGHVVGGTLSNLLLWTGDSLLTPSVELAGIAGTVRALTLELAAGQGIDCQERDLLPQDLTQAAGLFLTNSLIGCWPVRHLDGRDYAIGSLPWDLMSAVVEAARTPE